MFRRQVISLILLVCFSSFAFASDPIVQRIGDKDYVCFDEAFAQKILQMHLDYPKLELKLQTLDGLTLNLTGQTNVLTDANKNLTEQISVLTQMNADLNTKIESLDKWYRSPFLWFTVGLVVAGGAILGITLGTR